MDASGDNMVPKVHPLSREIEADDPMELVATPAAGDVDLMLECVIQEFAWMGMSEPELLAMFQSEAYPVLAELCAALGLDECQRRVRRVLGQQAAFRVREEIYDAPEPHEHDEPELIQLTIRQR